jgi:PAT family beta-lactamase induction signal transducer AmpG
MTEIDSPPAPTFLQSIFNRRILICCFTGFASGLPFYVLLQLVPAWLRTEGIGLKEIGFFTLVQLPYVWKFLWAPLLDRYSLPFLGRRRGWLLATQVLLLLAIVALGMWSPKEQLPVVMTVAFVVAVWSATLDIVLDAYRRELLPDRELGLGNSVHVQAYRVSSLVPAALGLILADHFSWPSVFAVMALFVGVGIVLTLLVPEAVEKPNAPTRLATALLEPFREYWKRRGTRYACAALAFMVLYKLGDNMATALSTAFYIDLGFSLTEIGIVAKNAALWPSIAGGIAGGVLMLKIGINRALWIFGVAQLVPILGFAVLSEIGKSTLALALVVAFDYFGVGLGTAAFVAFIARETVPALAATQIALFTALAAVPRTLANAITGFLVEGGDLESLGGVSKALMTVLIALGLPETGLGYTRFFVLCAFVALPGMLLLVWVAPWNGRDEALVQSPSHR